MEEQAATDDSRQHVSSACELVLTNAAAFAALNPVVFWDETDGLDVRLPAKSGTTAASESLTLQQAVAVVLKNARRKHKLLEKVFWEKGSLRHARHGPANTGGAQRRKPGAAPLSGRLATAELESAEAGQYVWRPRDVKTLFRHAASLEPRAKIRVKAAAEALGWDPPVLNSRAYYRLRDKVLLMRQKILKKRDPLKNRSEADKVPHYTYNWRHWLRSVFGRMPEHQATVQQLAVALQADPDIEPKLDANSTLLYDGVPKWKKQMYAVLGRMPEVRNSGTKRGKLVVYQYDTVLADKLAEQEAECRAAAEEKKAVRERQKAEQKEQKEQKQKLRQEKQEQKKGRPHRGEEEKEEKEGEEEVTRDRARRRKGRGAKEVSEDETEEEELEEEGTSEEEEPTDSEGGAAAEEVGEEEEVDHALGDEGVEGTVGPHSGGMVARKQGGAAGEGGRRKAESAGGRTQAAGRQRKAAGSAAGEPPSVRKSKSRDLASLGGPQPLALPARPLLPRSAKKAASRRLWGPGSSRGSRVGARGVRDEGVGSNGPKLPVVCVHNCTASDEHDCVHA